MLRVSTILQLQSVWETIPSQSPFLASTPAALSRNNSNTHIQSVTNITSAASLVLEDNNFSTSCSSSLSERSASVLPTPSASLPSPSSSIHVADSQPPTNESSNSDALYNTFEQVHPLTPTATSSQLQTEALDKLNASSNITTTTVVTLPPHAFPPPVPSKDHIHHHLPIISRRPSKINKVSDNPPQQDKVNKKKEKRSSKYGFFGSRSAATPPPLPTASSVIPSPIPNSPPPTQLIDGANKTLRRETSKFNLRRKSLSKKVKRAISTIKLNGTANDSTPPLPPTTLSH